MRKIILPIGIAFLFAFTTACQTKSKEEVVQPQEESTCMFKAGDDLTAFYIQNPKQKECPRLKRRHFHFTLPWC